MQIYLDNSATTRICDEALEVYTRVSKEQYGNPSSLHGVGLLAEHELERARGEVLASLGMRRGRVLFTASGTEANTLAIIGRALSKDRYSRGAKIITTEGEHASVTGPIERLEKMGFKTAKISTRGGRIDLDELREELTPDTVLVSIMLVNNETGALYDVPRAASLTHELARDALVHTDATQAYMKLPFTKEGLGADMITVSSHKIEGPKGVGALIVDESVMTKKALSPIIWGGGQELGLRSGTENVPAIAAFGEAVRIGRAQLNERYRRTSRLRDYLITRISESPELSTLTLTLPEEHAPHILNVTAKGIKSETLLHYLSSSGIFVSSGSACSSRARHSSPALIAYGKTEDEADSSVRISLSHRTTEDELDAFVSALAMGTKSLARVGK